MQFHKYPFILIRRFFLNVVHGSFVRPLISLDALGVIRKNALQIYEITIVMKVIKHNHHT